MTARASLDLAAIGNCNIASLIDTHGAHVWTCLPRLDGDPVFCSLLRPAADTHASAGSFVVELEGFVSSSQQYVRNTAIVETVLTAEDGSSIRITDFCPRFRMFDRMFRPMMIVRIVEPVAGHPRVRVRVRPLAENGAARFTVRQGSHHIRFGSDKIDLRLTTDTSLQYVLEERPFRLTRRIALILGPDEPISESVERLADRMLASTCEYWHDWVRSLAIPFEWQEPVIRSAITLKLCSYEDTGAIMAALTTSIPEAAHSKRNWDYRFCWLRDSYYTVQALNRLGATRTMESYLRFILDVAATAPDGKLQPVYGISGEPQIVEGVAGALEGYREMGPVRIGNEAYRQVQNDAYGAVIMSGMQAFFDERLQRKSGLDVANSLEGLAIQAYRIHATPDAGIWEFRGREEVHTFSSAMCWGACDRMARIFGHLGDQRAALWRGRANEVRTTILDRAWNPELNAFTDAFGGHGADASLLQLPEIGLVSPQDPRFLSTLEFLSNRLRRGSAIARYDRSDDFGTPEVAFNLCTFWYVNALAAVGRVDEARGIFESMLERRNHVGLFSEDIDPQTGELWGNFPQTYSMVGIINAAMRLSRPWEEAL